MRKVEVNNSDIIIAIDKKTGFPMTMTDLEMAKALGYDRISDCGLFKYVWRREDHDKK